MIDPNLIRKNPEFVKENIKKRFQNPEIVDVFLEIDERWRKLSKEIDELRHRRNEITKEVIERKKLGKKIDDLIKESKMIDKKVEEIEKRVKELNSKRVSLLYRIPNILEENVPIAETEEGNITVRKWGNPKEKEVPPHDQILEKLNCLDTKKASEVSGARFYYLKDKLVKLNLALIQFAMETISKKGYTPLWVPFMLKEKYMKGAAELQDFKETLYKIEGEDLYLIPSAEQSIISYHANQLFQEGDLPKKYVGFSTNFRREAGAHGKDTKGIFRVHQFDKVEQIIFSKPENSWEYFEELISNIEEIFRKLKIPYRVVSIASGDLNNSAAKKYDLEAWMPAQKKYREMGSCSNCLDYQSRNLMIRLVRGNGEIDYVHTLNCTGLATERAIVAIVENYYEDGVIVVPEVLKRYLDFEVIK